MFFWLTLLMPKSSPHKADFLNFRSTAEIPVSDKTINQVIGQDSSVDIIRKAAAQKRNVLLVGEPGTGKSMLALAMSEVLPVQKLSDILIYPNDTDPNNPKVRPVPAGEGQKILNKERIEAQHADDNFRLVSMLFPLGWFLIVWVVYFFKWAPDVIVAAMMILGGFLIVGFAVGNQMRSREEKRTPKLLVDNAGKKLAPFFEGTGARAGSLLGDVRHDPLQSGGLGTPPHLRVEPGLIHKASGGVLFVDELATLSYKAQQELLTAMQEKKYAITGQSEMSSGAMTRTEPVPCDFVLVAAGNYRDLEKVHPALRSRIRGYGYEVYMNIDMPDTPENRSKIVQFVCQEIKKDGKIPHFSREAVDLIIFEARRRADRKVRLTLKLRDLGGLVRAAGDIAKEKSHSLVEAQDVIEAKMSARTLEQQMVDKIIDSKREYEVYLSEGAVVGRVNGLAVSGDGSAGTVLPIEAEIAPAASKSEGRVIATGKLGEIAREAVQNVSAIIKRISGKDISQHDLHIQFLQTYEGVEGDSASVSVATAVISALEGIPVKQSLAMTGSLSVRGEVLPVGGVTSKVHAAIRAGFKEVIVPKANREDIVLPEAELAKIKIISVSTLSDVLANAFEKSRKKDSMLLSLKKILKSLPSISGVNIEKVSQKSAH
ncbi:MAG: ATP-dependent protease LonB [Candidatus Diapherotrites archaeon]|nr:ATP-dependent protease LonB [Candidatus Diapherotrites archaeon]